MIITKTAHKWKILGGNEGQLKECVLCRVLVLEVVDSLGRTVPCMAGFGRNYVDARPAPECPPTCEEAREAWHYLLVEEVMIS